MKRLELDIDRASWLVEMAMEWKDEKGRELPKELVERLSANLFVDPILGREPSLTVVEELASALFGSAAGVKIKHGATELDLDRKGIEQLTRKESK